MNRSDAENPARWRHLLLRGIEAQGAMVTEPPVFWRTLKDDFESLQNPNSRTSARFDQGRWALRRHGSFYSRFWAFARRGGKAAGGGTGEEAVWAWLESIRTRVPHYWQKMQTFSVKDDLADVTLTAIVSPRNKMPTVPPRFDGLMVVERSADKYTILLGHDVYRQLRRKRQKVVSCVVRQQIIDDGGWIEDLRKASIELCEQFESDAVDSSISAVDHDARSTSSPRSSEQLKVDSRRSDGKIRQEALSVKETATVLGVSEDKIRRMGKSGEIELTKLGPRSTRIARSEIARLRAERRILPSP